MQLRPGKPIVLTIRVKVLPSASSSVEFSATVAPGAGWRETKAANNEASGGGRSDRRRSRATSASRSPTDKTLILRGSPNTYTVTVTNKGPTTVTRLRLRVVTRLVSPSYDNAKGGYNPASGIWSGLSLARGGRVTLTVSGTTPTSTGTLTATADDLACCGLQGPCARKQQVDRQDHHRHPVAPTTIER